MKVNTISKTLHNACLKLKAFFRKDKTQLILLPVGAAMLVMPEMAFAAGYNAGAEFFCYIAEYFKYIVGTCALVAIIMWAIEHIFGVAKLHDMVIKVGIACAIVIGGSTLIVNSGLTTNCWI